MKRANLCQLFVQTKLLSVFVINPQGGIPIPNVTLSNIKGRVRIYNN